MNRKCCIFILPILLLWGCQNNNYDALKASAVNQCLDDVGLEETCVCVIDTMTASLSYEEFLSTDGASNYRQANNLSAPELSFEQTMNVAAAGIEAIGCADEALSDIGEGLEAFFEGMDGFGEVFDETLEAIVEEFEGSLSETDLRKVPKESNTSEPFRKPNDRPIEERALPKGQSI